MPAADPGCVFCKIVAGRVPCQRLFENEQVLAFLDINPLCPGHAVVIPKAHAERLEQLDPSVSAEIARRLGPLARGILSATGAADYNILQNNGPASGQVVPHVHFHIIPRSAGDGLGYRWNAGPSDPAELAALAERIAAAS
jgi:histidine triad (HIT) family protein